MTHSSIALNATGSGDRPPANPRDPNSEERDQTGREAARLALNAHFLRRGSEYRFCSNPQTVAFQDEGRRLTASFDHPVVAKGMVQAAQAKGWTEVRLRGSEDFKRVAWMEASLLGIKAIGYTPSRQDVERIEAARQIRPNRMERVSTTVKETHPVLHLEKKPDPRDQSPAVTVLERYLATQRIDLSPELRDRIAAAGAKKASELDLAGTPKIVKVFDPKAERASTRSAPQPMQLNERAVPSR
jgi:hypothetical protein